jgi:hypothetical protein
MRRIHMQKSSARREAMLSGIRRPGSDDMGFLGWIKRRGQDLKAPEAERGLFAEWRQDHEMAKERYETGKEPESRPIPAPETGKSKAAQAPAKRVKVRSRDIPF